MEGHPAIVHNHAALRRILAMLVAMAGLAGDGCRAETLPRCLHRAVLRLLRPAESAARRLIVTLARGLTVPPPKHRPQPAISRGRHHPAWLAQKKKAARQARKDRAARPLFPLLDTLPDPLRKRPLRAPPSLGMPRISFPGFTEPAPLVVRRPPMPDDPVDAAGLARRLAVLGRVLDDLPAQARRFARWRARHARRAAGRLFHRVSPLRPGRPPGAPARRRRVQHEVYEVLASAHALARYALERPDTS